jgi:hypothetical protein
VPSAASATPATAATFTKAVRLIFMLDSSGRAGHQPFPLLTHRDPDLNTACTVKSVARS